MRLFEDWISIRDYLEQHCEVMADTSSEHEQMPDGMVERDPIPQVEPNPD